MLALSAVALHFVLGLPSVPDILRLVGIPAAVTGLAMSVWGSRRFDQVGTNINTFDRPDVLVNEGLFRWSRNPMYLGFLFLLLGLAIGLGSWAGLLAPAIFFVAADRWYIPFEETEMSNAFDENYDAYTRQVRRWFGRRPA